MRLEGLQPRVTVGRSCGSRRLASRAKSRGGMQRFGLLAILAVAMAGLAGGCDRDVREADAGTRPQPAAAARTQPATRPAEPVLAASVDDPGPDAEPETKPAEPPPPVLSFLTIDGVGAHFPPTKLQMHAADGKVRAEMFSDLPRSAIADYDGNELYLEMDLDGAGPQQVEGASWRYKSTSSDKSDSENGIFLNGPRRRHLQPNDVLVKFVRRGDQLVAQVLGQFRAYEPGTPDALAPFVGVRGEIPVDFAEAR